MEALKQACKVQTFKSFENIVPGEYRVQEFAFVETKFGRKIKVETETFYCFLPTRFLVFINTSEHIDELNSNPQVMIYKGKDVQRKNRLVLDFQPVADSQWEFNDFLNVDIEATQNGEDTDARV